MRKRFTFLPVLLLFVASPLAAQDPRAPADTLMPAPAPAATDTAAPVVPPPPAPDTAAAPAPDTTAVAPAAEAPAPAAPAPAPASPDAAAAPAAPTHDWEFSLNPASRAPNASGAVQVTDGETENSFVVTVSGLPPVGSLDSGEFNAEVYTVWVVPSKDRVPESTMAGVLTVDESGAGRFEGTTSLETFGIIVAGATEASPALRAQGAVLTGIPVAATPAAPAPAPADTTAAAPPAPAPDAPAPEAPPAPAPDAPAPEAPAPEAPAPEMPAAPAAEEEPEPAAPGNAAPGYVPPGQTPQG